MACPGFVRKPQLLRSTAASFYCLMIGYLLLVVAADIKLLLLSTAIRSAGSAVLWIYSTLMLQYAVPNELLGRVLALEMALFTVSSHASVVLFFHHSWHMFESRCSSFVLLFCMTCSVAVHVTASCCILLLLGTICLGTLPVWYMLF